MESKIQIEIVGSIKEPNFYVAKSIAEGLKLEFSDAFSDPIIKPLFEFDWNTYLCNKKRELRGEVWQYKSSLMCFLNNLLLGDERDLIKWAKDQFSFTFDRPQSFYKAVTEDFYIKHLKETGHRFVFMDITIGGESVGRFTFELFSDFCPKTSKNFEALCTGEQGLTESGIQLCYKDSVFHRVVPNGWVQGGGTDLFKLSKIPPFTDISPERKGNGGESIYGPTFEDECFGVSHTKRGILGMANKGPHSNGSQFYITLEPTPWMDLTYVAFGQVVEGAEVLKRLEEIPTFNERPTEECKVIDCGALEF